MTIFPEHPWLAGATLLLGLGGITYTIASLRRSVKLARAQIAHDLAMDAARKLVARGAHAAPETAAARLMAQRAAIAAQIDREAQDAAPGQARHRAEYDARIAEATRARAAAAANMPEAGALTGQERERLGRMLNPERPAALDLGYSMRFTPNQEQRMRDIIREEIAKARAREMGAE